MTIAAEYYGGKKPVLDIVMISGGRRDHLETISVSGKREARAVAAAQGAKPWNF